MGNMDKIKTSLVYIAHSRALCSVAFFMDPYSIPILFQSSPFPLRLKFLQNFLLARYCFKCFTYVKLICITALWCTSHHPISWWGHGYRERRVTCLRSPKVTQVSGRAVIPTQAVGLCSLCSLVSCLHYAVSTTVPLLIYNVLLSFCK